MDDQGLDDLWQERGTVAREWDLFIRHSFVCVLIQLVVS
jgi:hypothetical protein